MNRMLRTRIPVTESSGNVFADLGFPNPEEELAKAQLLYCIQRTIKRRRLSRAAAARIMRIDESKVSALLHARTEGFPGERLIRLLIRLGHDVDISVRPGRGRGAPGRIRVL
jgi:predicted XRE-type DNA-binding protein